MTVVTMKVGDLVKWIMPGGPPVPGEKVHVGIVVKTRQSSYTLKFDEAPKEATVKVYIADFGSSPWFYEDELELINESR